MSTVINLCHEYPFFGNILKKKKKHFVHKKREKIGKEIKKKKKRQNQVLAEIIHKAAIKRKEITHKASS